jgi:hypothetical protein
MKTAMQFMPAEVRTKITECLVRIENVIPKGAREVEHIRPARETASGREEKVRGVRFSAFVSDPEDVEKISWGEAMISHDDKLHFIGDLLIDDDTMRAVGQLEVLSMDGDSIVGLPSIAACQTTVLTCHNCSEPIAVIATNPDIPDGRKQADVPVQVCSGCGYARYCSERCAHRAWRLGHHITCPHIRQRLHVDHMPKIEVVLT